MITTIYASYGVLGSEKKIVFATKPRSDIYDTLTVEIPDELHPRIKWDVPGEDTLYVKLPGSSWPEEKLDDVLVNINDRPVVVWRDDHNRPRRRTLKETKPIWYAFQADEEDTDYGTGSRDIVKAIKLTKKMGDENSFIAVINDYGCDADCIDIIRQDQFPDILEDPKFFEEKYL